jgi:hypothetical protein
MREALADPQLLGGALPGDSWQVWRVLLIASMGETLTDEERVIFTALTGRDVEPLEPVDEFWGVVGRRGGKTRAAGTLAAYAGCLCDHSEVLAPGERGSIPILAASTVQAERAFQATVGVLEHSPVLRDHIAGMTADTLRLDTRIDVQVRPANFRTIRGVTAVAAICDEVAFWMIEGTSNPDVEILAALRPALATSEGPLWVVSSPYARKGELYTTWKRHYGQDGDPQILIARGSSRMFNPLLPQRVIDRAYERDAAVASAEFGGEFRQDVEAFVDRDVVEGCIMPGIREIPPAAGTQYVAFCDPSGGSSDSFTLAIAHLDGERVVLDCIRERKPPFSPEAVTTEFVEVLSAYGVGSVTGDRYGGEYPREAFRKRGIAYELSDKTASELFRALLPLMNSGSIELVDQPRLVDQIVNLERRVSRTGRELISHPMHAGAHDDLANAVAGVASLVTRPIERSRVVRVGFG